MRRNTFTEINSTYKQGKLASDSVVIIIKFASERGSYILSFPIFFLCILFLKSAVRPRQYVALNLIQAINKIYKSTEKGNL